MNDINLYENHPIRTFPISFVENGCKERWSHAHWHEHLEIHFILDGTATFRCGNENIFLKKNECLVINSNTLHQSLGDETSESFCIILQSSFLEDNFVVFENHIDDDYLAELMRLVYAKYKSNDPSREFGIKGYAYLLVSYLIDNYSRNNLSELRYKQHSDRLDTLNNSLKYIENHYKEPITTKALAELSHVSEGHSCHIFKETFGKTAKEYINFVRVGKAKNLIKTTDMTIVEIAFCCGFTDANYFSRTFKKYMGATPTSLREAIK